MNMYYIIFMMILRDFALLGMRPKSFHSLQVCSPREHSPCPCLSWLPRLQGGRLTAVVSPRALGHPCFRENGLPSTEEVWVASVSRAKHLLP